MRRRRPSPLRATPLRRTRRSAHVQRRVCRKDGMPSRLSLVYPNGRTAEVEFEAEVRPGEEFDLFGKRWKVVGRSGGTVARYRRTVERRFVCRPVGD